MQTTDKIKQGQCFLDMVTELSGATDNAIEMAMLNNVSITDRLKINDVVVCNNITNKRVVQLFKNKNTATALSTDDHNIIKGLEGVGVWLVGIDFIVS